MQTTRRGQSLVEFALVLPLLMLLLLGMLEVGYAFYDYMVMANANREGIRLASRGQGFTPQQIAERIIVAGGQRLNEQGEYEPVLRTTGPDPNLGIIITYVTFNENGRPIQIEQPDGGITGTIVTEDGTIRPITWDDTRIAELAVNFPQNSEIDNVINQLRESSGYDVNRNRLVVIETFMSHRLLLTTPDFVPIPDPMLLYFRSSMRVTVAARTQQ